MADRSNNGMNMQEDRRSAAEKEEDKIQSEKANEYVRELMQEKHELDTQKAPNAARLLDQGKAAFRLSFFLLLPSLAYGYLTQLILFVCSMAAWWILSDTISASFSILVYYRRHF